MENDGLATPHEYTTIVVEEKCETVYNILNLVIPSLLYIPSCSLAVETLVTLDAIICNNIMYSPNNIQVTQSSRAQPKVQPAHQRSWRSTGRTKDVPWHCIGSISVDGVVTHQCPRMIQDHVVWEHAIYTFGLVSHKKANTVYIYIYVIFL